ncbi:MAG: RluA family pseudouridine synthase [Oscillospiraceae bacterium]|nr:RluA family pseudouridine synthase [Oscillospiraceae bacterium]
MKEFTAGINDGGQRIDKFLQKAVPRLPKSLMYKYLRTKRIKLNGRRAEPQTILAQGDVLSLYINDEFFGTVRADDFMKAPAAVDIVYEDENILIADKKNGLVVHEDESDSPDTLINRIKHYLYVKGEYDPEKENSFAPALCNRIDRNTGGMVIAAKNAEALRIMNEKIRSRETDKRYLCICVGKPPKEHDTLTAYMFKDSKTNTVTVSDRKSPENRTAVTEYTVLRSNGALSLLEIRLHTGRTHQIRAHMAYIRCPLLGDGKYGINSINREYGIKTQALYSYRLRFDFRTSAGILDYLDGKEFRVKNVWFEDKFL